MSKCLQGKSSGRKKCGHKRVTAKQDYRKPAKLVRSDRFQNCREIAQRWNASRSTTYRGIKEMGYANCIARMKPLLNFKQCKKRLTCTTEKRYWTVGQWSRIILSDESKFCISFGNRGQRIWRKPYEAGLSADKPGCTKSNVKFPQNTMVWGHHGEECQQLELDLYVLCEQMLLLLSVKKSWSIFCFRRLSNCLEMTSSHFDTTWLLSIMPNPLTLKP